MMKILYTIILLSMVNIPLAASDFFPQRSIETNFYYDYLTPDSTYADWKSADFKYFHRFNPKTTMMLGTGCSIKDESFGWVQTALYKDWLTRFSTYTSLTASSQTKWVGNFRFDNDLYWKLGSSYQFILVGGQTVIVHDSETIDYLLSIGGIIYYPHLILEARQYYNMSNPGQVWSNSQRLSVGFGTRGKWWTTIVGSLGAQKYLGLGNQVNQDVQSISLTEEIWLTSKGGIKVGAGYLTVEDGYDKYNGSLGVFWGLPE
jgi:YaiO family outer membrane protein